MPRQILERGWLDISLVFVSSKAVEDCLVLELCVREIKASSWDSGGYA